MRYLLISLSVLLLGCSSYPKKMDFEISEINSDTILNPYFSDLNIDYIYKAQIEIKEKNWAKRT